jgi:hypothetical protein
MGHSMQTLHEKLRNVELTGIELDEYIPTPQEVKVGSQPSMATYNLNPTLIGWMVPILRAKRISLVAISIIDSESLTWRVT